MTSFKRSFTLGAAAAVGAFFSIACKGDRREPPSASADPSSTSAAAPPALPQVLPSASVHMSPEAGVALVGKDEGLADLRGSPYDASAGHGLHGATIREGALTVSGRLAPELVQRSARRHFDELRACYEIALRDDPTLSGKVSIKLVIGATGKVMSSADAGSEIRAPEVAQCVAKRFAEIAFPAPDGGVVTVVYRLVFEPPG